ncbi:unnamed protein product [Gadus morhua 'NCC']
MQFFVLLINDRPQKTTAAAPGTLMRSIRRSLPDSGSIDPSFLQYSFSIRRSGLCGCHGNRQLSSEGIGGVR